MTHILPFPHPPSSHKSIASILRQNLADASEHLEEANTQCDVLTEAGRRWREEALHRYNRANLAMVFHRTSTMKEAVWF